MFGTPGVTPPVSSPPPDGEGDEEDEEQEEQEHGPGTQPYVNRSRRSTYLITYSRTDESKVASREAFAELVVSAFTELYGAAIVEKYAVALENHKRIATRSHTCATHLHMSVKLTRQVPFKATRDLISSRHDINVHFSTEHSNYFTAFNYLGKEDTEVLLSRGHEKLLGPPRTLAASKRKQTQSGKSPQPTAPKRLRKEELAHIIVEKQLQTALQVRAFATDQKTRGEDTRLWNFIVAMSRNDPLEHFVERLWSLEKAPDMQKRATRKRLDILSDAKKWACICDQRWKPAATEILNWNEIPLSVFRQAVIDALEKGRGKGRNVILIGRANCGKTFLFTPLMRIFDCFVSPESKSFAWVAVEHKELVFLNDYRWSPQQITWATFLAFLEGAPVQIAAPKTSRDKDILFQRDVPIFATAADRVRYDFNLATDLSEFEKEQEMMNVRWCVFELKHQIQRREEIPPCPRCFAEFILRPDSSASSQPDPQPQP